MRYIVTGGAGFIGSHLVDELIRLGHEVIVVDDLSTGERDNVNPLARFVPLDFVMSTLTLENLFRGADGVFHLGAMGRVPMCVDNPHRAYEVNVMGSVNVLEASRRAGVPRVVLSSSCIVYSDQETAYKTTKVAMEDAGRAYRTFHGISTVSLRYANVYGTRQQVGKDSAMFAMLRDTFNKEGHVKIFGDGEQTRDWINVSDVVKANILAMNSNYEGEVDICTGRNISLNEIVKEILQVPHEYHTARAGDAKHIIQDPTKATKELGFTSSITLEEGIKEVWK